MRFEVEAKGIILGLAAMPEPKARPRQKQVSARRRHPELRSVAASRSGWQGAEGRRRFRVAARSRHREKAGQIEEIAVGVIDSKYESYLFYESLDKFLQRPW